MATNPQITVDDPHTGGDGAHHDGGHHGGDGHAHGEPHMMVGHDGELHPSNLQFYFVSTEQQFESAKLGMWLFLATEILLFGGMFVAYGIFRVLYPELYEQASMQLDTTLGAFNTLVLLLSSLTMAWAIRAAQMDNRKLLIQMLSATIVLAGFFLVVKYFEYEHKYHLGILPGEAFVLEEGTPRVEDLVEGVPATPLITFGEESEGGDGGGDAAPAGETGSAEATPAAASAAPAGDAAHSDDHGEYAREGEIFSNRRAGIFFGIYYMMTGVHAIHIIIGMIAIGFLVYYSWKGKYSSVYYTPVENVGLYWHIVDVIWIFVFPLMYLI